MQTVSTTPQHLDLTSFFPSPEPASNHTSCPSCRSTFGAQDSHTHASMLAYLRQYDTTGLCADAFVRMTACPQSSGHDHLCLAFLMTLRHLGPVMPLEHLLLGPVDTFEKRMNFQREGTPFRIPMYVIDELEGTDRDDAMVDPICLHC